MGKKQQTTLQRSDGGQIDTSRIPGWGVDADADNDPTYPYRARDKDDHSGEWDRPTQQGAEVEVLRSIEHKRLPAVFGTTVPPSGVSGVLRRAAFKYSESNWAHWLLLMGADRVNVVEGVLQDIGRGKIPNVPAEMGVRSEYRHNKRGLATKLAVIGGVAAVAAVALSRRKNSRPPEREPVSDYDED
jgi:hypothetical protein